MLFRVINIAINLSDINISNWNFMFYWVEINFLDKRKHEFHLQTPIYVVGNHVFIVFVYTIK